MSAEPPPTITLLQRMRAGDPTAPEELYGLVRAELRRLAAGLMRGRGAGHTLQPTALVHEAWMKLTAGEGGSWRDHGHFVATAATAMRQILVDHARAKRSAKRGGGRTREPLDSVEATRPADHEALLQLDEALTLLGAEDERARRLAELKLFAGMGSDEIASALAISSRTYDRLWRKVRDALSEALGA